MRVGKGFGVVLVALGALFAGAQPAGPALAGVPELRACAQAHHEVIEVSPDHALPGETVRVSGSGFDAACKAALLVTAPDGDTQTLPVTTRGDGTMSAAFVVGDATGDHVVQAVTADETISLAAAQFGSGVFVVTDKPDYQPGETATFSGRGFTPGETIELVVRQIDPGVRADRVFTSVADKAGAFVNTDLVLDEDDHPTTLSVTATGASSGRTASAVFSDADYDLIQKRTNNTTATAVASLTANFQSEPTTGNLIVAVVAAFAPTDISLAGWNTAIKQTGDASTPSSAIFYKLADNTAEQSVMVTFSPNTTAAVTIYEYDGVLASGNPLDMTTSNTGTGATATTGVVTTSATDDLLIGAVAAKSSTATLSMAANTVQNGFVVEAPTGTVNGASSGAARVALQSAVREHSSVNNATGFTISGTGVPGSILGWRGQVAAFTSKTDTTTTVSASPPSPSVFGQPVTLTATVTPVTPGNPTGTVDFFDGAALLCDDVPLSSGTAACTTSSLSVGNHTNIRAVYSGDASFNDSTSAAIAYSVTRADTATTLTSSQNPAPHMASVTFTATVTAVAPGGGTPTGNVTFRNNGVVIPGCNNVSLNASGIATCTTRLSGATVNTHPITATYAQSASYTASTGNLVNQTVHAPACPITVDGVGSETTYASIQDAVNALPAIGPCTINVLAGTYAENVTIAGKNGGATQESERIVIQAVGDVALTPAASGSAFTINNNDFLTVRGFDISGFTVNAFALGGGAQANGNLRIEDNTIHDNGSGTNNGGIQVAAGNTDLVIVNNLIRNANRNAIDIVNTTATAYVVNNTIVSNGFNGVDHAGTTPLYLINNLIVGNGTQSGTAMGRAGLFQGSGGSAANVRLFNNVFYGNSGGDISPASAFLDATDSGNRTTTGSEGTGVVGCTFADCLSTHALDEIFVSSAAGDFHLKTATPRSPAIDRGINSSLSATGTERVPATDFEGDARPQDGDTDGTATVDAGYDEARPSTATLNVVVEVTNDNGGTATASDIQVTISGANATPSQFPGETAPGTAVALAPNQPFSISVQGTPSGYAAAFVGTCGPAGLPPAATATCTIKIDDLPAFLRVIKTVKNDNGGTAVASDWTMNVDANNPSQSSFPGTPAPGVVITMNAGPFSVTESGGPGGYSATPVGDCQGTAVVGGFYVCELVNDDDAATLTVIKHVVNDNGGTAVASDWTMHVAANNPSLSTFPGAEAPGVAVTIDSGPFSVTESGGHPGYQASFGGCVGTAVAGGSYTCTITNDDIAPTLEVVKNLEPNSDPGRFNLLINGVERATNVGDGGTTGAVTLNAGSHTVSETAIAPAQLDHYTVTFEGDCAADGTITLDVGENGVCTIVNTIKDADGDHIPDFLDCTPLVENHVVDPNGVLVPYVPAGNRHTTLQAAVNAAADNDVISMYGNTTENVAIGASTGSAGKDLRIVGCGRRITAASNDLPVIAVEQSAGADDGDTGAGERDVHIDDVDLRNGAIGYLVQTSAGDGSGTSTLVKSGRADNAGIGIKIEGDGNWVRNANSVSGNAGDGIQIVGNSNIVENNRVSSNGGHGIVVTGDGNVVKKNQIGDKDKGNAGDGIFVRGAGTSVVENKVLGNGGDGIDIAGGTAEQPNVLKKNQVGDKGAGNLGNGIVVGADVDAGNGTDSPVELEENTVKGNALHGIVVDSTGHQLKKNTSGGKGSYASGGEDNGGCEFLVVAGNFNGTGNKANSTTIQGKNNSAFPTGCKGTS